MVIKMKNQCSEKKNVEELLKLQKTQAKQMTIIFGILKFVVWATITIGLTALMVVNSPPPTGSRWGYAGAMFFLCGYSTFAGLMLTGWGKRLESHNPSK